MIFDNQDNMIDCNCRGINPDCQFCEGRGYYYEIPKSREVIKNVNNSSDPFPLKMSETKENKSSIKHVEIELEKYADYLFRRRQKRNNKSSKKRKGKSDIK